jgi:hypothetical protein
MDGDLIRGMESCLLESMLEMILDGNAMERHPVDVGLPQGSPVSLFLIAIYPSGLIQWVKKYISEDKGLSWVATSSNVNHHVLILEFCGAKSIEWANRLGLQFDTTKTEAPLFMHRGGHRKHLRPKLTAKIRVRCGIT